MSKNLSYSNKMNLLNASKKLLFPTEGIFVTSVNSAYSNISKIVNKLDARSFLYKIKNKNRCKISVILHVD